MKYDTWDHVCDFPIKELNVLIGHYVTHRHFTDFLRFADLEGWNGENNSALVGASFLPPTNILHALVLLSSKVPSTFFFNF